MLISNEIKEMITDLLTVKDYKEVARKTGYSLSTVTTIIGQGVGVNHRTKAVLQALIDACLSKMEEREARHQNYRKLAYLEHRP